MSLRAKPYKRRINILFRPQKVIKIHQNEHNSLEKGFLLGYERGPFGVRKGSFHLAKGPLLEITRGGFEGQNGSFH